MRARQASLSAAMAVALLWPSSAAQSPGAITGKVTLTAVRSSGLPVSPYGRRGVAPRPARTGPETRNVIVYLAGTRWSGSLPATNASVVQRGEQFLPPVTAVTTGSSVAFPNDDPFFHNVFSLSRAATFDLGRYPSGESRSQAFRRPGIVKVFCHIHSHMSALIMVLDHPWFTVPHEDGAFTLPRIPAGEHTLVAWHERIGERRERVRVSPGSTLQVSFTLPVLEPGS